MNIDHALRHLKDGGYESAAYAVRNLARDREQAEARVRELVAENQRLRAFAFGDAPEWEKANCSLKHRVRELEAEVERLRSPYQAFTAERRVTELEAERDELRAALDLARRTVTCRACAGPDPACPDCLGCGHVIECKRCGGGGLVAPGDTCPECGGSGLDEGELADQVAALRSPAGPSTDEDKPDAIGPKGTAKGTKGTQKGPSGATDTKDED